MPSPAHPQFTEQEIPQGLWTFITQRKRLGLLIHDAPEVALSALDETIAAEHGQCIVLDVLETEDVSLASRLLSALELWREDRPFRILLPDILRHNPNSSSPFINRAILWQRLGDRLIEEEEPDRTTVLVLKNLDAGDSKTQHDVARLIRFHATHRIHRTFLATVQAEHVHFLEPEIRRLVDAQFEI